MKVGAESGIRAVRRFAATPTGVIGLQEAPRTGRNARIAQEA